VEDHKVRRYINILYLIKNRIMNANQNSNQEETRNRFKSGNVCYYSVQNLLFFQFDIQKLKTKIYKTKILRVVLYGCETWSLTLRGERRLIFENMVLRRIFEPKRGEVTGEWRKLHNVELNDLYFSPNIIRLIKSRRITWVGHVARMWEKRVVYRVLVGKPQGKRPLGKPRSRWEDKNKMRLQEVGCGVMDWIEQSQDRDRWQALVNAVMNFRVP